MTIQNKYLYLHCINQLKQKQMETKHTKGEWNTERVDGISVWSKDNQMICKVLDTDRGEKEANAKLIAAAPELLEACIIALKYFNGFDSPEQNEAAFHALNNAIKKATE